MKITIRQQDTIASILDKVRRYCESCYPAGTLDPDSERFMDCCTIIDEFHANMRKHVSPGNPDFEWYLSVDCSSDRLTLIFQYFGPRFDPTQPADVDTKPVEQRDIGGLGLAIIANLSDSMRYTYENGMNTLTVYIDVSEESGGDIYVSGNF